jgi:hypothetical protein
MFHYPKPYINLLLVGIVPNWTNVHSQTVSGHLNQTKLCGSSVNRYMQIFTHQKQIEKMRKEFQ